MGRLFQPATKKRISASRNHLLRSTLHQLLINDQQKFFGRSFSYRKKLCAKICDESARQTSQKF